MKKELEIYCRTYLKHPDMNLVIEYVDDLRLDSSLADYHDKWRLIDLDTGKVYAESEILHDVLDSASTLQRQRFGEDECDGYIPTINLSQSGPNEDKWVDCDGLEDIKNSKDFWHQGIGRHCWKAVNTKSIYQGKVSACRLNNGWPEVKVEWILKNNCYVAGRPGQFSWERVANLCFDELQSLTNYIEDKGEISAYCSLDDYSPFANKTKLSNTIKPLSLFAEEEYNDCQEVPS